MEVAEEERLRQRSERWEKGVALAKKRAEKAAASKSQSTARKETKSSSVHTDQSSHPETDQKESRKKQRADNPIPPNVPVIEKTSEQNPPSTRVTITSGSEVLVSGDSGRNTTEKSGVVDPSNQKTDQIPNPESNPKGSEIENVSPLRDSEPQTPRDDQTQQTEGERETERTEQHSKKQAETTSPTTETTATDDRSGMGSWSGSNMLITTEVEEDNTIVSIGEFAFHSKHKKVVRRRTKKAEGLVLWAPQGEKPEERVMESASALGTFAVMNLGAADESRREIETLRAQVSILTADLQKTSSKRADLIAQLEQECVKQEVMAEANLSLQNQVKDLRAELKDSEISEAEIQSFRQEAFTTSDRGLDARISFFKLIKSTKEMHLNLLRNEELLSLQGEEINIMKGVRRKVTEYQRKNQIDQIQRLDAMELKHIQVSLNSAETLNEKAWSTITSAKKECRRI